MIFNQGKPWPYAHIDDLHGSLVVYKSLIELLRVKPNPISAEDFRMILEPMLDRAYAEAVARLRVEMGW